MWRYPLGFFSFIPEQFKLLHFQQEGRAMRLALVFWLCFSVFCSMALAGLDSKVQVPAFSPVTIPVQWSAGEELVRATTTLLFRIFPKNQTQLWQTVPERSEIQGCSTTVEVQGPQHLQFRTAVQTETESERAILADFDTSKDFGKLAFVGSHIGFNATIQVHRNADFGGGSFHAVFSYNQEQDTKPSPEEKIGFPFNSNLGLTDWSGYRYLEFAYWAGPKDPMHILIQSASQELYKPITNFSEFPKAPGWNSIVIDLEKELGDAEARKSIQVFALIAPVDQLDLSHTYTFELDSVSLWQSRSFAETQTDDTPPSAIHNLRYTIQKNEILWKWDAPEDHESGLAGYAYYWGKNKGQRPPDEVMIQENEIRLPYADPGYQTFLNFMVKACNRAGQWSETAVETLEFYPKAPPSTNE